MTTKPFERITGSAPGGMKARLLEEDEVDRMVAEAEGVEPDPDEDEDEENEDG